LPVYRSAGFFGGVGFDSRDRSAQLFVGFDDPISNHAVLTGRPPGRIGAARFPVLSDTATSDEADGRDPDQYAEDALHRSKTKSATTWLSGASSESQKDGRPPKKICWQLAVAQECVTRY
jgi:hypothetical protein